MYSNSPFEENATPLSCLPFTTLMCPNGNFPGSRSKCSFILIPSGDLEMETMIMHSGGQVLLKGSDESEDEYAVTILCERFYLKNPNIDCILPLDTFSSVYIHEVIETAKKNLPLPSLNSFRITQSNYQAFKADEILWKRIKWSDLVPLAKPAKKRITAQQFVERLKSCWETQPFKPPNNKSNGKPKKIDQTAESKYETAIKEPGELDVLKSKPIVKTVSQVFNSYNITTENGSLSSDDGAFVKKPLKRLTLRPKIKQFTSSVVNQAKSQEPPKEKGVQSVSVKGLCSKSEDYIATHVNKTGKRLCGRLKLSQLTVKKIVRLNPGQKSMKSNKKPNLESTKRIVQKPERQKNTTTKHKRPACRPFTHEEGQRMLDLVCEKKAFMYTKGEKLFQWMELSQHFPGRTFQSLREHWKKKVHPNVLNNQIYDITPADLDHLLNALKNYKWSKHHNVCPDYAF